MSDFARIPVYQLELDTPWCANTYGVAPCTAAGTTKCYQTYGTCQDKTNYSKTIKTLSFCSTGAPIPAGRNVRPYIKKGGADLPATEIDPRAGLAPRASCTFTLVDEPCPDTELDPYYSTRVTAATGTYWGRLLARHNSLSNVTARVKRAYFTNGWNDSEFITETYIVESIKGPDSKGEVRIVLKDPIKLADRTKLPVPSTGKLSVALSLSDLQVTLSSGDGSGYSSSGYIRIGDQIIRYTGKAGDVLSWPDGTYWGQFNTTAATASVGDVVQECLVYSNQSFTDVVHDLLNRSGIADANIDLTGIAAEDTQWLGADWRITTCLHEPTSASTYLQELAQQTGGVFWWDPVAAKVKYKFIGPQSPAALTSATLTETSDIVLGSVDVHPLDDQRMTRAFVGYNLTNATANVGEAKNYRAGRGYVDAGAESANEYGDVRSDVMYSRWLTTASDRAISAFVKRRVGQYRDVPRAITVKVDAKDADIEVGDLYDVTTSRIVDSTGATRTVRCLVVKRKDNGRGLDLTLRTTNFSRRYGFIAPNGTSNYPNNGGYACACLNTGLFSDGSSGYLII